MDRTNVFILCILLLLLASCTLPAPRVQQPTAQSSEAAEAVNPTATETVNFATEALASTLAQPTMTLTPTIPAEPQELQASPAPTQIPSPTPFYRYIVQPGTPVHTANFVNPGAACDWMGIGGQVFGRDEKPVSGLIVEVGGNLDGEPILVLSLTGNSSVLGPGGYEITLADKTIASQETLWLQLYDLNGMPQSEKISFDTMAGEGSCDKNLIIINFSEIGTSTLNYFFPYIFKDAPGR